MWWSSTPTRPPPRWGFLKVVREDFRTREVPVALYSAHDDYREALRVLNTGAQAYFKA